MEKIQENLCLDVVFVHENIRTCLFPCNFVGFQCSTFTPHYIIMDKGLYSYRNKDRERSLMELTALSISGTHEREPRDKGSCIV